MDDLLERMSRAMEPEVWIAVDRGYVSREKAQPCLDKARKGLEALREPTPSMLDAGYVAEANLSTNEPPGEIWQAMIDAALAQGTEARRAET